MFDVCFLCLYDIHIFIYICRNIYLYIYIYPGPSSDFILRHRTKNETDILKHIWQQICAHTNEATFKMHWTMVLASVFSRSQVQVKSSCFVLGKRISLWFCSWFDLTPTGLHKFKITFGQTVLYNCLIALMDAIFCILDLLLFHFLLPNLPCLLVAFGALDLAKQMSQEVCSLNCRSNLSKTHDICTGSDRH